MATPWKYNSSWKTGEDTVDYRYFGDPLTDGSWRIVIVGTEMKFQRRESGVWVEKGAMQP